jgi:hypothetical protein
MRRVVRRDVSEPGIVKALEQIGASVSRLDGEEGLPDLLVGFRGEDFLLECKDPETTRSYKDRKGELRTCNVAATGLEPGQERWHARWRGRPVVVVRNPAEAVAALLGHRVTLSRVLASEQAASEAQRPAHGMVDEVGAYPTEGKAA